MFSTPVPALPADSVPVRSIPLRDLQADDAAHWAALPDTLSGYGLPVNLQAILADRLRSDTPVFAPGEFLGVAADDEEFARCCDAQQLVALLRKYAFYSTATNPLQTLSLRTVFGWLCVGPRPEPALVHIVKAWQGCAEQGWRAFAVGMTPDEYNRSQPAVDEILTLACLREQNVLRGLETL